MGEGVGCVYSAYFFGSDEVRGRRFICHLSFLSIVFDTNTLEF